MLTRDVKTSDVERNSVLAKPRVSRGKQMNGVVARKLVRAFEVEKDAHVAERGRVLPRSAERRDTVLDLGAAPTNGWEQRSKSKKERQNPSRNVRKRTSGTRPCRHGSSSRPPRRRSTSTQMGNALAS